MAEIRIKLSGWQAVVGILVVFVVMGVRVLTLRDAKDDAALVRKLESLVTMEYFPDDVERLKSAVEAGDGAGAVRTVASVLTSRITIESVQLSAPLLSLATAQKTIVKVTYSLDDSSGNRAKGTKYYRFRRGAIGNTWQYEYETGVLSYYLNFR